MGVIKQKNIRKIPFGYFLAFSIVAMFCNASIWFNVIGGVLSTPTPQPKKISPLALTLEAIGLTQTAVSLPTATATITPTETAVPTIANTTTPLPTRTFTPVLTDTLVPYVPPTEPPLQSSCSCSGDTLNCSDFGSHASAQSCFNSCMNAGAGDIHRLDQNNDGDACESLP